MTLTFPVTPRGQGRARHNSRGFTYTPGPTRQATKELRELWMLAGRPVVPDGVPFTAEISATYKRPKKPASECPRRSDVDNIAKLVLDAMQGHAFTNDALCQRLVTEKAWGEADSLTLVLRW